jgi:23S rRNA (adenine1618-N6)-methyltransferase
MHKNNLHNGDYDFPELCVEYPQLKEFVFKNKYDKHTINFAYPKAVKALNTALLKAYYNIDYWSFSDDSLCPPIPSRVDYIHQLNDLLIESGITKDVKVLDIGCGASCIYPLLGNAVNNWKFVGTEIDNNSLNSAQKIINENNLNEHIKLRFQSDKSNILNDIITENDSFSASMCNPPFYSSQEEADESNDRKMKGLGIDSSVRNFSGSQNELWYEGGEKAFLHNYLYQSSLFKTQCHWFTSLVSKTENVQPMYDSLRKLKATQIQTKSIKIGNKITRIVAWSFM